MPTFAYRALSEDGKIKDASLSAKNKEEVGLLLQQQGLTPISIKAKERKKTISISKKVSLLEKISFTRYMGLMLNSGLSLSDGVDSLAAEAKNPSLRRILNDLAYGLRSGEKVSTVLSRYPAVFDAIFISMIRAGEVSGTLNDSFIYLAKKLKKEHELQRRIKGAMVYPVIILLALLGIGSVLLIYVLPRIGKVFLSLGVELPLTTRLLLSTGQFLQQNIVYIFLLSIVLFMLGLFFVPRHKIRQLIIEILLRLPITGKIVTRIDYARLTHTLGVLMASGVSITEAVDVAFATVNQGRIKKIAPQIKEELIKGKNLSNILKERNIFPAFVTQMLTVGEKSGSLEEVLEEIGNYYAQEAEEDLKNITEIIEPVLILVVGIISGLMVISIIAPIYSLIGDLQVQ